jgi:hypothetical protein
MPLCALALHQLRYHLAFGSHAGARLGQDGHAYLSALEPFVLLAAALAIGSLAGAVARTLQSAPPAAIASQTGPRIPRPLLVWGLCAAALLALYCGQEFAEGLLAPGHPAGLAGIFGHGGWIAVPLAVALGAALAGTLTVAEALVARLARRHCPSHPRHALPQPAARRVQTAADWRLQPLSGLLAGLSPPPSLAPA